ncbi:lysophospholipid acyltransferase family protein [Pendulispora albinea]|uniref:Lipid A biosynthesis acyltransferase n=1 Tax=Pendulispora albinea TaxID=2741071 RepID=A0ABZ2LK01_9BACT
MNAPPREGAAPDVREGGRWGTAQAAKNALLYWIIRAVLATLTSLPPRRLRALGRGLGACVHLAHPRLRKLARANVQRALPHLDEASTQSLVAAAYRNLGGHLGDAVASLRPGAAVRTLPFPEKDRAILREAQREGRGVLFVSAHLGPWERVAATLVDHGFALTTVARESYDPRLTALYDRLRGGVGVRSIYRGAAGAPFRMLRTLRAGGVLGMPMDLRARVPSIAVPFLGIPAATPVGPARMACRTGAAVVIGTAARGADGAMVLTVTRIPIDDLGCAIDRAASERCLTERINDELSRRILDLPEQWVWMHPRWPDPTKGRDAQSHGVT